MKKKLALVLKIDLLVGCFLVFLIAATSWSLFRPEFFRVHDYVHGARIAELVRSAAAGHLPVRWTANFGYGYGMPLFEFYAPLPYYVGGIAYWVSGNLVLSTKLLFLLANIGSVIGSYFLGRELYGKKGGVIVAAAYALAPYRAVNLFVRGAIGESWGMMMMPFALWAGIRVLNNFNSKKIVSKDWWILLISLVGLFLSHNLSTLMYVPVSIVFLVFISIQRYGKDLKNCLKVLSTIFSNYVLAIGLAAFYMFPALLEKDFTVISSILSGYFNYVHHFLYIRQFLVPNWGYGGSAWGPDDGISFFLGYGQLTAVLASMIAILWFVFHVFQKKRSLIQFRKQIITKVLKTNHFQLVVLSGVIVIGALYATLLKSQWWWDTLPLIAFIQFPWRWLSIAILFLSLVAGYGTILIQSKRVLRIALICLLALLSLNIQYFQPESYLSRNEDFYYENEQLIRTEMSGILPDYIPKELRLEVLKTDANEDGQNKQELLLVNIEGEVIFNKDSFEETEIVANRPHQKLVRISSNKDSKIEFNVAWFPGWKAEVNGKPAEVEKTSLGLVSVAIPEGKSQVGIYFGSTPVRWWSDVVSMASFILVIWLLLPKNALLSKKKNANGN